MARTRYKVYDPHYPYLITSTIVDWLPLFSISGLADIILESLKFMQSNRDFRLFSYVILENHLHLVVQSPNLEADIRAFKSYTARKIIDYMKAGNHTFYLKKLKEQKLNHHINSEYQVWQEGYHPKQIMGDKMMIQKVEYVHNNPLKRGYVDKPEHWRYSSARNYLGLEGLIPVTLVGLGINF